MKRDSVSGFQFPIRSIRAEYLTTEELAKDLGICTRTLYRWRDERIGPPITIIGNKRIFYRIEAVRKWALAREGAVPINSPVKRYKTPPAKHHGPTSPAMARQHNARRLRKAS